MQTLPDGTLNFFYSDIVPYGGARRERTVSRFVSADGGDTWKGPEIVPLRPGSWAGIPSSTVFGNCLYLAHEERDGGVAHPFISVLGGNEKVETFEPFSTSLPKDPLARAQMRVWVMPKNKVGEAGELKAFVPVANPLGEARPMYWNGLAPLGGDEVMATCQRGADLFLVRGRIKEN